MAPGEQDADQTAADLDQTQADSDQAASDADQMGSDADQALADLDQHASDRDQAAADWERSHPDGATVAREAHEASRVERDAASRERHSTAAGRSKTTGQRLTTAARRDGAARARDLTAAARDRAAQGRDDASDARDAAAEARERRAVDAGSPDDAIAPLRALRVSGTYLRRQAAQERIAAAADREQAAADREQAAADREQAAADRRYAGVDELTGVFRRGTGELALIREIDRSRRPGRSLVLATIDVDGLKAVNDTQGHPAGDAVLRDVATAIIATMRSYDVTVRWGGDEFVCALSDVTLEVASERMAEIQRALDARRPGASISCGLAELEHDDTLESLMARGDSALYRAKANRDS
jgi:diguanylate cyclase (GGDEF)-like protein